jgi:hypothetical protein
MSAACTHRTETVSGASREYRSNAATTSRYPGELQFSNFVISLCPYGRPALSVSSRIGAAELSSTICNTLESLSFELSTSREATYVSQCGPKISLLLLPKEVYPKVLHQRREHVRDILQHLGSFMQGVGKLAVGIYHFRGGQGIDHAATDGR